jgi:hypothetical protein
MLKKVLFGVCFLIVTTGVALAQDTRVEFEGRYWITDLTGEAKVTEAGLAGTNINIEDDLGVEDEDFPDVRFTWYTGPNSKLRLAYNQISYDGDKNVEQTIQFSGNTYTMGARVITDLDVKYLRLGWAWQFVSTAEEKIKFGTLLEAKGFWVDTSLNAPSISVKESEKFAAGVPTVGVALDINPHRAVNIFSEVSGIPGGKYGYFLDAEAGVKIIPTRNLSIIGGYRIFDVKAKEDEDHAKIKIAGPFVGATLRF